MDYTTFLVVYLVVGIAAYLFYAFCQYKIATKLGDPNAWYAFVPILNLVQVFQLGGESLWYVVLMIVPCLNLWALIMMIIAWKNIAENLGKEPVLGILAGLPVTNLVCIPILAFTD
jgi:hypothetical protein